MTSADRDVRRNLTPSQKLELHRRYFNRIRSGETVGAIARDFGIVRTYVSQVVKKIDAQIQAGKLTEVEG